MMNILISFVTMMLSVLLPIASLIGAYLLSIFVFRDFVPIIHPRIIPTWIEYKGKKYMKLKLEVENKSRICLKKHKIDADAKSLLSGKVELHRFLKITQP